MPFDGSGNYTPAAAPNFPAIGGTTIQSGYYNNVINDIATALSNTLTRDGQGKPTANIDWNNKNLSNVNTLTVQTLNATTFNLTNPLDVSEGGTGQTSLTAGYVLKGSGTSPIASGTIYDDGVNVGIGTATPARLVQIAASAGAIPLRVGSNLGNFDIGGSDGTVVSIDSRTWSFSFQVGGFERMRINTSGDVSIGSAGGDFGRTWRLLARDAANRDVYSGVINNNAGANARAILSKITGTGNSFADWALVDAAGSPYDLFNYGSAVLYTAWAFGGTTRLRLNASGSITSENIADAVGYKCIPVAGITSGTLTISELSKCLAATGGVTIPASVFPDGGTVAIYNDTAGNITITEGAGLTLRLVATTSTGNRTLAARGWASIWFKSTTEAVISGAGVS